MITGFFIAIGADPPGSFNVNQDLIIFMFAATGALGSLALGLAAEMNRVKITILFLSGAVGFVVYYWIRDEFLFMSPEVWVDLEQTLYLIYFIILGAIIGAILGLMKGGLWRIIILALVGAFGFWIGETLTTVSGVPIAGVIGFSFLGIALGCLDKD